MQDLPLIDISGYDLKSSLQRQKTIGEVERACRDIGFMYITGHGIPADTISAIRGAVTGYFDRPQQEKLRDRISRDNYRGFIPLGFFSANSCVEKSANSGGEKSSNSGGEKSTNSGVASEDGYEGYKLHSEIEATDPVCVDCDLYGPNKWPEDAPAFRQAVLDYWQACDVVAHSLLEMLAVILGVDCGKFLRLFDKPLTNMTLLHYPVQTAGDQRYGIHPHKDTDALTILVPDPVGGLMVKQTGARQWITVNAPAAALVVNIGDLLELWSGGYFVSTPHKVVNTSGSARYSFPYFVVPRYDVVVEPLVATQPGFQRSSVHVGDVSREVWRTNWPDTVPGNTEFDLGTLTD